MPRMRSAGSGPLVPIQMNTQTETVTGNHMRSAGCGLLVHMHMNIQIRQSLAVNAFSRLWSTCAKYW